MRILQEFNVDGDILKGRITGDWSKDSEYGFKLVKLDHKEASYGVRDLEKLTNELSDVLIKIKELNAAHERESK